MINIGEKIADLIKKKNMPVAALTKILGYSKPSTYAILKRPNIDTGLLEKISDAFGVDITYFFDDRKLPEHHKMDNNKKVLASRIKIRVDNSDGTWSEQELFVPKIVKEEILKEEIFSMLFNGRDDYLFTAKQILEYQEEVKKIKDKKPNKK